MRFKSSHAVRCVLWLFKKLTISIVLKYSGLTHLNIKTLVKIPDISEVEKSFDLIINVSFIMYYLSD